MQIDHRSVLVVLKLDVLFTIKIRRDDDYGMVNVSNMDTNKD